MATKKKKTAPRKKKSNSKGLLWLIGFVVVALLAGGIYLGLTGKQNRSKKTKSNFLQEVPKGYASVGIDVSHHQGKIDWDLLFNDLRFDTIVRFVYCKATESLTHLDTKWEHNRKTLNNMGILNGAYHFFDGFAAPRDQAAHFLNHWQPREIDLPPVLDVETEGISDQDLIAKMRIWLTEVEKETGYRPIIYTSDNFYETKFKNKFPGYYFWIAAYSKKPTSIDSEQIIHWQFSETGTLPGISEMVDLNVSKIAY
jgi:lysozyme